MRLWHTKASCTQRFLTHKGVYRTYNCTDIAPQSSTDCFPARPPYSLSISSETQPVSHPTMPATSTHSDVAKIDAAELEQIAKAAASEQLHDRNFQIDWPAVKTLGSSWLLYCQSQMLTWCTVAPIEAPTHEWIVPHSTHLLDSAVWVADFQMTSRL